MNLEGSVAKFARARRSLHSRCVYAAKLANCSNGDVWFDWNCCFRIMWATSMPASVAAAAFGIGRAVGAVAPKIRSGSILAVDGGFTCI